MQRLKERAEREEAAEASADDSDDEEEGGGARIGAFRAPSFAWMRAAPAPRGRPPRAEAPPRAREGHACGCPEGGWAASPFVEANGALGLRLLELLFPALEVDTGAQRCPVCRAAVSMDDAFDGFEPDPHVYTVHCVHCRAGAGSGFGPGDKEPRPFVARFRVMSAAPAWVGSNGPGTPLYCEWLSPWALQKEVSRVLAEDGVAALCSPAFRGSGASASATVFWNLVVYFRRYGLPLTFLLSSSFAKR